MNPTIRIVLAVLLVGIGVGLALTLTGEETKQVPAGPVTFQSSRDCKSCHEEVWNEWWGSHHQIAYLNPEVRALSDDFRNKDCQACHLPQPIAVTGFAQRTLPRRTRPDEGVGCISCHIDEQGRVMSTRARPDLPCQPVERADFASVNHCASCHNQHQTTDQWRASHFAQEGRTCNACHMPEVARGHGGTGRRHVFLGAHDEATLKEAGRFELEVEAGEAVLSLTNVGAGHNFPTEERHRAVDMMYRFVPREGEPGEWQLGWRCRQPYRDEKGEDTQLPAGETKTVRIAIPEGTTAVEGRLWYRLKPYIRDDDPASTLLDEQRVELP